MNYRTYWSILDAPTNSIKSYEVFLFVFTVATVAWGIIKIFKKTDNNYEKTLLLWSTGIFSLLSLSLYVYLTFFTVDDTDQRIKTMLASTEVGKVEGVISNFNRKVEHKGGAQVSSNVTFESFQVDTVTFHYDDYLIGRFNSFSKTYNGVLRNGLKVRITYRKGDNSIQQIEIKTDR